jgi:hypothetical protein
MRTRRVSYCTTVVGLMNAQFPYLTGTYLPASFASISGRTQDAFILTLSLMVGPPGMVEVC